MRRTLLVILAAIGLLATVGLTPATAATATPTMDVSYNAFQNITNQASACAVVDPGVSYTIPVPASVAAEVNAVYRYGYHSITGYAFINGGAYPGQVLVANRTVTQSLYIPYLNTTVQIQVLPHQYDAFVPGLFGRPCTQWVHLVAQG